MNWIKLQTTLLTNQRWKRLSDAGKAVFPSLLMLAGREETGGTLRGPLGPFSLADLAHETHVTERTVKRGVEECLAVGLLTRDDDGALVIEKWAEKAGETSRERTRAYRERRPSQKRHGDVTVTSHDRHGDALEKRREEKEKTAPQSAREPEDDAPLDVVPGIEDRSGRLRGPAFAFARWFTTEAMAAGALPAHTLVDDAAYRDVQHAERLLDVHEVAEIEARSRRLFARKLDRTKPLLKAVSVKTLAELWDWFAADAAPATKGSSTRQYLDVSALE